MTDAAPSPRASVNPLSFLFLAIALGGFVYAGLGFIGYREAQIPSIWKETPGQVVESGIDVITKPASDGPSIETYQAKVRYRYEVDEQFYVGTKLSRHEQERTLRGVAETEIEDLGQGTNVTVFYDPASPQDAVLQKSDTIGPMQAISAGLAIGLTCFAMFVISFRRRSKELVTNPKH